MLNINLMLTVCLILALPGCASLSPRSNGPIDHTDTQIEAKEDANLPKVELTGEILYRLLTADMAVQQQEYVIATHLYLLVATDTLDPRVAEKATWMALFSRQDQKALEAARIWVAAAPQNRTAREKLVDTLIRNGDDREVQEHLDYLLALGDESRDVLYQLVVSLAQHNRHQDIQTAFRAMQSLVERHPDNPSALLAFSYIAIHNNELSSSRTAMEVVLDMRPKWLEAMNLYARILRAQNHPYEAAIYLAGVLKKYPDAIEVRLNYARLLVETRQLDDALAQYLLIVDEQSDNEDALFVAALLSLQLNSLDQAKELLVRLEGMGRRLDAVNFYLGQIAEMRNETDNAIDYYAVVENGEHYIDAQLSMIGLLAQHGDLLLARAHLDKLRASNPSEYNRIDLMEAKILEDDGQLEESMVIYEAAYKRDPDDRGILIGQALLADKLNQFDLVERNLLRVLEKSPDDVSALNTLGFSMSNHTTRYQEAYQYLQRAVQLRPHSAAILDSMGWVLYRLGRLDEAVGYLRRSLEMTQDHEVSAHLGEVLWVRGNHEEAREIWQQALERTPDDKFLLDVMKRFGQ